jgi:hypothetical protein
MHRPLGQVKSLKDREDCDLDPEQLVSDVLLDEGKAASDGYDQEAVFVVVHEPGQPLRHDSVLDLSLPHYQNRPRPTPPRFTDTTSTLGKRTYSNVETSAQASDKRSKLLEIPETQEEPVPTIERSPELVRTTGRDEDDDDVFDDAAESQDNLAAHFEATSFNKSQFPRTPSGSLLPNGLSSSTADKFKSSSRRDLYAPPESDIEDSQMSPHKPDARDALLPASPSPVKPRQEGGLSLTNGVSASSEESDGSDGEDGTSDDDTSGPAPLNVPKIRKTQSASDASDKSITKAADNKKRKPEQSTDGAPRINAASTKKQKVAAPEKKAKNKLDLPPSASGRTSGVVSELDSPGEQLSQNLWDNARSGSLAEGVKNALVEKPTAEKTKNQRNKEEKRRRQKAAKERDGSSASGSRPGSSAGLTSDSNTGQVEKPTKVKKLAEKIQDAKVAAKDAASKVVDKVMPDPPKDPKTPATVVRSAYIVPNGMTEEQYLQLRAKHESTPQPPKSTKSHKKKDPTPAPQASKETPAINIKKDLSPELTKKAPSVVKSAAKSVKEVAEKAPEVVKKVLAPTNGHETSGSDSDASSASSDDGESSSEESETEQKKSATKKAGETSSSKPDSKAKVSAVVKKSKDEDKKTMPPPSSKKTAKKPELSKKKSSDSSSSVVTTASSSGKSIKKTSRSESPASGVNAIKAEKVSKPTKKAAPAAAVTAPAKEQEKPLSRIKQLQQQYNSQSASKANSPAPAAVAAKKQKPAAMSSSSSSSSDSDGSSSSDGESDDGKKEKTASKKKKGGGVPLQLDHTVRTVTPELDDSSDDE